MLFFDEKVISRCRGQSIWKGDVVICFVCVRGELITLPRSRYMEKRFSCSSFYAFFLPEKESVGKKSRHKGGLRRDSLRSYSAQSPPLCIPPMTAQPIAT